MFKRNRESKKSTSRKRQLGGFGRNFGFESLEPRLALTATSFASVLGQEVPLPSYFTVEETETAQLLASQITTGNSSLVADAFDAQSFPVVRSPQYVGNSGFSGFNGSGVSVVVIDTGADLDNPLFGPDVDANGIGDRIIQQFDYSGANDNNANDFSGHGSNVAGIIAEMAPGVNLIIHKVFSDAGGGASFNDIQESLQWVSTNLAAFNIVAVNMSLGTGNFQSTTVPGGDVISDELAFLDSMRVSVVAAAGNGFFGFNSVQGVSYPASLESTISVGATYDAPVGGLSYASGATDFTTDTDRIASFSQRHSTLLDIMAPGAIITSAGLNGSTNFNQTGTSQAAPHVTAAAAMLQDMSLTQTGALLTRNALVSSIQNTGVAVNDGDNENDNVTNTGLTFRRLDMLGAAFDMFTPATPSLASSSNSGSTGDLITNDNTPTITATVPAGSFVRLYVDNIEQGTGTQLGAGVTLFSLPTSTISNGNRNVTIRVAESSAVPLANMSNLSSALTITIDTGLPTTPGSLNLVTGSDTGNTIDNITSDTTPTFDWTAASDTGSGISGYWWAVDDNTPQTGGTFVTSTTLTAMPTVPGNGPHNMYVIAVDVAGNFSSIVANLPFTIDTVAPSAPSVPDLLAVSDTGVNTDNITSLNVLQFTGTAQATTSITLLDGVTPVGNVTSNGAGAWTITSSPLANGTRSITARATDVAGNTATSPPLAVVVDPVAPTVLDVVLRGSGWASGVDYAFSELVAAGDQLRPIATQGVNTISIQFSEHVRKRASAGGAISDIASTVADGNLLMELKRTVNPVDGSFDNVTIPATAFTYNSITRVATWTFPSLADDKYAIHLKAPSATQSGIVDPAGNALDSSWSNDDNGTPDTFGDDLPRTFTDGDGIAGSTNDEFRFHFALLAGDYDGDGQVEHALESATGDGNGDGIVNAADTTIGVNGKRLAVQKFGGADFNDDEIVDSFDLTIWQQGFGGTTEGDVDGDGDVDGNDFLLWQRVNGSKSAWYVDSTPIVAGFTVGLPPKVINVVISGSQSTHAPFSFATVDGSGAQLKTVPVGGADAVSIVFSEGVNVSANSLIVVGLQSASMPALAAFSYDAATYMASWRFEGWRADNYLLALSDGVTDVEGNWLDGEWTNPASITTVNAAVSEFPSGDGVAGGWFNFVATLLPGDATRNNIVGTPDYDVWLANVNNPAFDTGAKFTDGDMDGDGDVDQTDYDLGVGNLQVSYRDLWILGDLNGDWKVDAADVAVINQNAGITGATRAQGDLNGDGLVTMADLDLAYAQYGLAINVVS